MASSDATIATSSQPFRILLAVFLLTLGLTSTAWARQTVPDSTYGSGGSKTTAGTTDADGTTHKTETFRDKGGIIRESYTETIDSSGRKTTVTQWFDDKGVKQSEEELHYDPKGKVIYDREEDYNAFGIPYWGDIFEMDASGKSTYKAYNPETEVYEEYIPRRWLWFWRSQDASVSDGLYLAGAAVLEDSANRFATYGVEASYTRALWNASGTHAPLGLMADVQWTRGSSASQTFTKFQVLAGVTVCARAQRDVYVGVHVLAGVSRVTDSSFALAAGVDIGKRVNEEMDLQGRVDYNPTFQAGGVSNNVRFSAGMRWRF